MVVHNFVLLIVEPFMAVTPPCNGFCQFIAIVFQISPSNIGLTLLPRLPLAHPTQVQEKYAPGTVFKTVSSSLLIAQFTILL